MFEIPDKLDELGYHLPYFFREFAEFLFEFANHILVWIYFFAQMVAALCVIAFGTCLVGLLAMSAGYALITLSKWAACLIPEEKTPVRRRKKLKEPVT